MRKKAPRRVWLVPYTDGCWTAFDLLGNRDNAIGPYILAPAPKRPSPRRKRKAGKVRGMGDAARKVLGETWTAELHGNACECSSRIVSDAKPYDEPAIFFVNDGGHARGMHAYARIAACAPEALRLLVELETHEDCHWCKRRYAGHAPDCRLVALLKKAGVRE